MNDPMAVFNRNIKQKEEPKAKAIKLSVFDKLNAVFTKKELTKQEFGHDGYMLIRWLSMKTEFIEAMNMIQKYQGVLGYRLLPLLQTMFGTANKAPWLEYIKSDKDIYSRFNKRSIEFLKKLFLVGTKRLEEYGGCLYCDDEEIEEILGLQKLKKERVKKGELE